MTKIIRHLLVYLLTDLYMKKDIKIIAEIGWNHMGDMNLAEKMIINAASTGADYCKFQT